MVKDDTLYTFLGSISTAACKGREVHIEHLYEWPWAEEWF